MSPNLDRLEQLVAELSTAMTAERNRLTGIDPLAIAPQPGNVAPGELIESAWGNQVTALLDQHEDAVRRVFATAAEMKAALTGYPIGTHAFTTDTGTQWTQYAAGNWAVNDIQSATVTVTTNAGGDASFTFARAFTSTPDSVLLSNADFSVGKDLIFAVGSWNATSVPFSVVNSAGAVVPNKAVRLSYSAKGWFNA
jgi:hypothetical protein